MVEHPLIVIFDTWSCSTLQRCALALQGTHSGLFCVSNPNHASPRNAFRDVFGAGYRHGMDTCGHSTQFIPADFTFLALPFGILVVRQVKMEATRIKQMDLLWLSLWIILAVGITPTESKCPSFCSCVKSPTIVNCQDQNLNTIPPVPLDAVSVNLDHNDISIVRNNSFDGLTRLGIINLENNGIIHIEAGAFHSLTNLQALYLGENSISQLPLEIFQFNRKLHILDLHSNSFTEIPDYVLFPLHNLQILNLSFNSLTTPMLGQGFSVTKQLNVVDLSGNNLVALESHVFQATLWWDKQAKHYLNLSYCNIQHIFPNSLNQLYHIDSLSLEGNPDIPPDQFQSALNDISISSIQILNLSNMSLTTVDQYFGNSKHRNLVQLVMSHNTITSVKERTFYYLVNLSLLDLSHNSVRRLGSLRNLLNLEYLYLSHNQLTSISETLFDGLSALKVLDLSHNRIVSADDKPFQSLFDLQYLYLQSNYIESFDIRTGFENLEILSLHSNRLFVIPSIGFLMKLRELDVSANGISFLGPNTFSQGQSLRIVNTSHNSISYIDEDSFANSVVDVLDMSHNQLTILHHFRLQVQVLNLQFNNLRNISLDAFREHNALTELNISHNEIRSFPRHLFTPLHSLRSLSMDSNPLGDYITRTKESDTIFDGLSRMQTLSMANVSLQQVPVHLFSSLRHLETLDLSSNMISRLTPSVFTSAMRLTHLDISRNFIKRPDVETLRGLNHLKTIDLSENPLQCTCDLIPFCQWLSDTNVSVINPLDCAQPPEWKGTSVLDFHLDQSTCWPREKLIILITGGCAALLILMTCVLFCIICKCRRRRKRARDKARHNAISYAEKPARIHFNPHQTEIEMQSKAEWV